MAFSMRGAGADVLIMDGRRVDSVVLSYYGYILRHVLKLYGISFVYNMPCIDIWHGFCIRSHSLKIISRC